jgi:hypothetical protein
MLPSLTFRTADSTRWGGGNGSDLSAVQVDLNFWNLSAAVLALEASQTTTVSIDYITQPVGGNQFFVVLTNHQVLGPFTIPTSQWNPRGNWAPSTSYAPFDTVSFDGTLYLVLVPVTSAATFNPFATNGTTSVYAPILTSPQDVLPLDGLVGQRLVSQGGSPLATSWEYDRIRMFCQVDDQPNPNQVVLQYLVVDNMVLPVGLAGSIAFSSTNTQSNVQYTLNLDGAAIGTINFFGPSPEDITVTFPAAVTCVPGNLLTLVAPAVPDTNQAGVSFTIVAQLLD